MSAFVWRDLVTAVFWLAVAALALGTARRAALWRAGRPAAVAWSGLLAIPKRYFVDLHHVVAREPAVARAHVAVAGGALACLATGRCCACGWPCWTWRWWPAPR